MSPASRTNKKISEYSLSIVTGGSSGIGKTVIERILKVESGSRICNISRTKPPLFFNDTNTQHLECDLSSRKDRATALSRLLNLLNDEEDKGPILLVNNAGFGLYDTVSAKPSSEHLELLEVNIAALVDITVTLLPILKKRGGSIINIASTSAFQATPYLASYGASKSFVLNWTLALNEEFRNTNINALAVCPGPTRTNFFRRAGLTQRVIPDGYSSSSEEVVEATFKALAKGKSLVTTGLKSKLVSAFSSRLPKTLGTRLAGKIINKYRPAK
ncbi:SDR family NAD(P)-dependent oxidoreductase [Puniceicoccaceae bacterium K14]|nr:SDR family NAD(P)-dependent oxidoreductase [Puniceicoccaceae bacterium K14]